MKNAILKSAVVTAAILLFSITANAQTPDQKPKSVDAIFEKMDVNKDGKLVIGEVKGPLKQKFTLLDADADGFITKEEMENAPARKKPMAK